MIDLPLQFIPSTLAALTALGLAFALISADADSPTSRAIAIALAASGLSFGLGVPANEGYFSVPLVGRWLVLSDALAIGGFLEWILRVRHTIPAEEFDTRLGDRALRAGQGAGALYAVLGVVYPEVRANDFLGAAGDPRFLAEPGFWLFAVPVLFAMLTGTVASVLLLRRRPDKTERVRVVALMAGSPFFMAGFILPSSLGAVSVVLGGIIFLVGTVHYLMMQGERGMFMARFLSPQVERLVRDRGLKHAMQQRNAEITVVCSDLRGFTAYAQAHASSTVIKVLREYYDAVGEVVAGYGGTIKDYAGDGILILIGAPLTNPHHARCGIEMARRIRAAATAITQRWSTPQHRLGVGIGVASGVVTVGIIGSSSRWEYTAVGPAVNLASRLCEQALDQEVLVDAQSAKLAGEAGLEVRTAIPVKGYVEPVALFAVPAV